MAYKAPVLLKFGSALRLTLGSRNGSIESAQFKA